MWLLPLIITVCALCVFLALMVMIMMCACVCFRYCAGTTPWGNPSEHHDFEPQRHDDGYIEVIGFTMTSLVQNSHCVLVTMVTRERKDDHNIKII